LAILGEALAEARELNLQPLGEVKVRCEKLMPNGRVLVQKSASLMLLKSRTKMLMMRLTCQTLLNNNLDRNILNRPCLQVRAVFFFELTCF